MSVHLENFGSTRPSSDHESLESAAQALLECLDVRQDGLNSRIEGITRICLAEILAHCQSKIAMRNMGRKYSDTDLQAISAVEPQMPTTFPLQRSLNKLPNQENTHLGTGLPLSQLYSDSLSFGTSSSSSHELNVQPFDESIPQHSTCPEGQTLSGPSATHYQESHVPAAQDSQEKVRCTWLGCTSVVKKANYARHLNESHLRRVKAICHRCGRTFPRTYMKRNHEFTCRA